MKFSTAIVTAALAALASTAPVDLEKRALETTWVVQVVTATTTVYGSPEKTPPAEQPAPPVNPPQPANFFQHSRRPTPPPASTPPAPVPPPVTTQPAEPAPTTQPAPPSGGGGGGSIFVNPSSCPTTQPAAITDPNVIPESCGVSWLDTINFWRQAYGKSTLSWSPKLAQIAMDNGVMNAGGARGQTHTKLEGSGSFGEILAPGPSIVQDGFDFRGNTPFGMTLTQGWLCENIGGSQLHSNGVTGREQCPPQPLAPNTSGYTLTPGDDGHFQILLGNYKSIGCAFTYNTNNAKGLFAGLYGCDFA